MDLHLKIHRVRQTLVRQHMEFQPELLGNIILGFINIKSSPGFLSAMFQTVLFPFELYSCWSSVGISGLRCSCTMVLRCQCPLRLTSTSSAHTFMYQAIDAAADS